MHYNFNSWEIKLNKKYLDVSERKITPYRETDESGFLIEEIKETGNWFLIDELKDAESGLLIDEVRVTWRKSQGTYVQEPQILYRAMFPIKSEREIFKCIFSNKEKLNLLLPIYIP